MCNKFYVEKIEGLKAEVFLYWEETITQAK